MRRAKEWKRLVWRSTWVNKAMAKRPFVLMAKRRLAAPKHDWLDWNSEMLMDMASNTLGWPTGH